MSVYSFGISKVISVLIGAFACLISLPDHADGGIALQSTRIIYPQSEHQQSISVSNRTTGESFLIQSWVEDASGHKSPDFVVTPPLYLSAPGNENTLRIMLSSAASQPADRETLYTKFFTDSVYYNEINLICLYFSQHYRIS